MERKEVYVGYSTPFSDSDEVAYEIKKMAQGGWVLVGRANSEGLFSFGAHTTLRFERPERINGNRISKMKFEVKTVDVGYCNPRDVSGSIKSALGKMEREGWIFAGRSNHEGFFGLTAYTRLTFMRPRL
jgi:hypothetical protein